MRTALAVLLTLAVVAVDVAPAIAQQSVPGYVRKDGTYVAPHYRSTPDRSYNNNWSTSPNVNPLTGQQGTQQPTWNDRPPQPSPWNVTPVAPPLGTRQRSPWSR